jgi:hypothetical protein
MSERPAFDRGRFGGALGRPQGDTPILEASRGLYDDFGSLGVTGNGNWTIASLGNGISIGVAPWRLIAGDQLAADGTAPSIGGPAPTEIVVLPFPIWKLADMEVLTDAESQQLIIEEIVERQIDIHFDYHHQSLYARDKGYVADAAAWIPWNGFRGGSDGLVASGIRWVAAGQERVESGAMRYFSPVVYIDERTGRAISLESIALTNTPRSNEQTPLTADLLSDKVKENARRIAAARVGAVRRVAAAKGGTTMPEWLQALLKLIDLPYCYDNRSDLVINAVNEVLEALNGSSSLAASGEFAKKLPTKDATILQALVAAGMKIPDGGAIKQVSADLGGSDFKTVFKLLELDPETATPLDARTAIVAMKTTMVPRVELEKKEKELAAARETGAKSRIDRLVADYADRIPAWEKPSIEKFASIDFEAVEADLKKRTPIVAESVGKQPAPPAPVLPIDRKTQLTASIGGETRHIAAGAAEIEEQVNAILAEKGWGPEKYGEANQIRKDRIAAAMPRGPRSNS